MGMLILEGQGPRGTNRYRFPLENGQDGSVRLSISGGVTQSPRQPDGGDTVSGDTVSGDTAVSPKQTTRPVLVVVNADIKKISDLYEHEFGVLTAWIGDAIRDAVDTYPPDWIPEAMQIAVESNVRTWKYVEGILKNCMAKKIRPSLNKLEPNYANSTHREGGAKGKGTSTGAKAVVNVETDAAHLAAINRKHRERKAKQPASL